MRALDSLQRFDFVFSQYCLTHKFNYQTAKISRVISHTGDGPLYALVGVIAWWLEPVVGGLFLVTGLLAFLFELPIYWLLKNTIKRDRPSHFPSFIKPSDQYSLPSGHTAAAFVMAYLLSEFFPSFTVLVWCWAGLIGLSRVLLGVHFLSDIAAGAMLGIFSAQLALEVLV